MKKSFAGLTFKYLLSLCGEHSSMVRPGSKLLLLLFHCNKCKKMRTNIYLKPTSEFIILKLGTLKTLWLSVTVVNSVFLHSYMLLVLTITSEVLSPSVVLQQVAMTTQEVFFVEGSDADTEQHLKLKI